MDKDTCPQMARCFELTGAFRSSEMGLMFPVNKPVSLLCSYAPKFCFKSRGFFMGNAHKHTDLTMMQRALNLAVRGQGYTASNPMVGCVIAHGEKIVGEGWHRGRNWHPENGLPHAEIEALRAADNLAPSATAGATAYVTLEPCNHHGTTPPCAHELIEAGIVRVVYAMADPNVQAAGGANALRAANIVVEEGLCKEEARLLNRAWIYRTQTQRPFVTAKFAASLDGKIATNSGESKWITSEQARNRAHDLRQACDAIIVGAQTVIADNPSLTVRNIKQPSQPLRIILDSTARTNPLAKAYNKTAPGTALLVTTGRAPKEKLRNFHAQNIDTLCLPDDQNGHPDLLALMDHLGKLEINNLMVEGGAGVLGSFFDAGLIQEVWAFLAPVIIGGDGKNAIGGKGATTMQDVFRLHHLQTETLGPDILMRGLLPSALPAISMEEISCSQAL